MKKIARAILLFLASFLTISLTSLSSKSLDVNAADPVQITVENKTVHRGQTFEVNVDISNNTGILSLKIDLSYNKSVMSLVGVNKGEALRSLNMTTTNPATDKGYLIENFSILWDGRAPDKTEGTICKLMFESRFDAPEGSYEIGFTLDQKHSDREYGIPADVNITNGYVRFKIGAYQVYYVDWDWDGTKEDALYWKDYNDGDTPIYPSTAPIPTRASDNMYSYAWSNKEPWVGVVSSSENLIIYQANYIKTAMPHQITYFIAEGVNGELRNADYWISQGIEISEGDIYKYGEQLVLTRPSRADYTFYGWYVDSSYSVRLTYTTMPAKDLILYGYFKYNIREDNVPTINLTYEGTDKDGVIAVDIDLIENTGLTALVFSIYHQDGIKLVGFENLIEQTGFTNFMLTDWTNTENGYDIIPFKFYFESGNNGSNNSYETGKLLRLFFERSSIDTPEGSYWISVKKNDATYFDENDRVWYTRVNFKPDDGVNLNVDGGEDDPYFTVPIGTNNYWKHTFEDERTLEVLSDTPLDINVELRVESKEINKKLEKLMQEEFGKQKMISSEYTINLYQNNVKINIRELDTVLEIKIKLTDDEFASEQLQLFYVDDDGYYYEFKQNDGSKAVGTWHLTDDGEYIVFYTDHLSEWVILTDLSSSYMSANAYLLLFILLLPSIAAGIYIAIIMTKYRKKERLVNYS